MPLIPHPAFQQAQPKHMNHDTRREKEFGELKAVHSASQQEILLPLRIPSYMTVSQAEDFMDDMRSALEWLKDRRRDAVTQLTPTLF